MSAHNIFVRSGRVGTLEREEQREAPPAPIDLVTCHYYYVLGLQNVISINAGWTGESFTYTSESRWEESAHCYEVNKAAFKSFRRACFVAMRLSDVTLEDIMSAQLTHQRDRSLRQRRIVLAFDHKHTFFVDAVPSF